MKKIYIYIFKRKEISIDKRENSISFKRFKLPILLTINHRRRFIILSALAIKTNSEVPLISRRFNNPALIIASVAHRGWTGSGPVEI